jgi:hypothetical protein
MCMEKKEGKNRKERKKINICMREWKKEEKEKRGVAIKIWEGWIKWKEKK